MAVLEDGVTAGQLAGVNSTFRAMRAATYPVEVLSWNSIGAKSGAITGLAANAPVFSFRNLGANPILIRRVGVGFIDTTVFTVGQIVDWSLHVARAFTVSDSGGTAIAVTGNTNKHRTSLAAVTSIDCRIATTVALTAGTRTLDTNLHAVTGAFIGALGAMFTPMGNNLFSHDPEDYPLVLAQNEGFILESLTAMGAGGAGTAYVNMEFAEATTY